MGGVSLNQAIPKIHFLVHHNLFGASSSCSAGVFLTTVCHFWWSCFQSPIDALLVMESSAACRLLASEKNDLWSPLYSCTCSVLKVHVFSVFGKPLLARSSVCNLSLAIVLSMNCKVLVRFGLTSHVLLLIVPSLWLDGANSEEESLFLMELHLRSGRTINLESTQIVFLCCSLLCSCTCWTEFCRDNCLLSI